MARLISKLTTTRINYLLQVQIHHLELTVPEHTLIEIHWHKGTSYLGKRIALTNSAISASPSGRHIEIESILHMPVSIFTKSDGKIISKRTKLDIVSVVGSKSYKIGKVDIKITDTTELPYYQRTYPVKKCTDPEASLTISLSAIILDNLVENKLGQLTYQRQIEELRASNSELQRVLEHGNTKEVRNSTKFTVASQINQEATANLNELLGIYNNCKSELESLRSPEHTQNVHNYLEEKVNLLWSIQKLENENIQLKELKNNLDKNKRPHIDDIREKINQLHTRNTQLQLNIAELETKQRGSTLNPNKTQEEIECNHVAEKEEGNYVEEKTTGVQKINDFDTRLDKLDDRLTELIKRLIIKNKS